MKTDIFLNILSSGINTIAVQLVCYPLLAYVFGSDGYGTILLLMGLLNLVGGLLSTSLNNSRLLLQKLYPGKNYRADGDFNLILLIGQLCGAVAMLVFCRLMNQGLATTIFMPLSAICMMYAGYHSVSFRLRIDYKKTLVLNCFRAGGYLVGVALAFALLEWSLPFFLGEFCGCVYLWRSAFTTREPYSATARFGKCIHDYGILTLGNLASSFTQYADRLLIYPILGPSSVSNYNVASYLGKTAGVVANPVSSVLLTYYSKENEKITLALFYKRILVMAVSLMAFYICVTILAKPILSILYPNIVSDALPYIELATAGAMLSIFCGFVQPMVLSYSNAIWQPIIQYSFLAIYIFLAFVLSYRCDLLGFCIANVSANAFRLLFMCGVSRVSIKRRLP